MGEERVRLGSPKDIECQRLVFALDLASGCLQTMDMIPILTHVCFQGDRFYAYDDKAATVVKMRTGLRCGVRGDTLISMLKPLRGEIKLEQADGMVTIKGKNNGTGSVYTSSLATLPESTYLYEDPEHRGSNYSWITLTEDIVAALELASESVSRNAMDVDWSGVNLVVDEDGSLVVCACDNMTVVTIKFPDRSLLHENEGMHDRVIVPLPGLSQLKRVFSSMRDKDEGKERRLILSQSFMAAEFSGSGGTPDVKVISKLVKSVKPFDFIGLRDKYMEDANKWSDLPLGKSGGFLGSLDRALAACRSDETALLRISVTDDELAMSVDAQTSLMHDVHKLESTRNPPGDAAVSIDPKHLARFANTATRFAIVHNKALCLRNEDSYFIIGGITPKTPSKKKSKRDED